MSLRKFCDICDSRIGRDSAYLQIQDRTAGKTVHLCGAPLDASSCASKWTVLVGMFFRGDSSYFALEFLIVERPAIFSVNVKTDWPE